MKYTIHARQLYSAHANNYSLTRLATFADLEDAIDYVDYRAGKPMYIDGRKVFRLEVSDYGVNIVHSAVVQPEAVPA